MPTRSSRRCTLFLTSPCWSSSGTTAARRWRARGSCRTSRAAATSRCPARGSTTTCAPTSTSGRSHAAVRRCSCPPTIEWGSPTITWNERWSSVARRRISLDRGATEPRIAGAVAARLPLGARPVGTRTAGAVRPLLGRRAVGCERLHHGPADALDLRPMAHQQAEADHDCEAERHELCGCLAPVHDGKGTERRLASDSRTVPEARRLRAAPLKRSDAQCYDRI